jgi:hypothetical protein
MKPADKPRRSARAPADPDFGSPRVLSQRAAAAYCGMSPSRFKAQVAPKIRRIALPGRPLYDKQLLDAFIDAVSCGASASLEAEAIAAAASYCDSTQR